LLESDMLLRHLLTALTLTLVTAAALAQDVRLYAPDETIDPNEVATILDQSQAGAARIKMRSLRLLDEAGAAASIVSAEAAAQARAKAVALPVQFAFDSSDILPAARAQLDALAQGVRLLPATQYVVIEGHTDATGSPRYNELLSQQRAQSVKRYLVAMHGIDPARLKTVGLGMYLPLPGHDPRAPENRRVQFRGE
jgi:outer membrane protein OmpA-like peptidoglycan-associated protein